MAEAPKLTPVVVVEKLKDKSDGKEVKLFLERDASQATLLKALEQSLGRKPGASCNWSFELEGGGVVVPSAALFARAAADGTKVFVFAGRDKPFEANPNAGLTCFLSIVFLLFFTPKSGLGLVVYAFAAYKAYTSPYVLLAPPQPSETGNVYAPLVSVTDSSTYPGLLAPPKDNREGMRLGVAKTAALLILLFKLALSPVTYTTVWTLSKVLGIFGVALPLFTFLPYGVALYAAYSTYKHVLNFNNKQGGKAVVKGYDKLKALVVEGKYADAAKLVQKAFF